jgi:amino acid adenylation domain-containing protein
MNQNFTQSTRLFLKGEIEQSIPDRFEMKVLKHRADLAIGTSTKSLTYEGLNAFANRIAHAILKSDIPSGDPVALLLEQDSTLIASILGVLKAGNIYVPLDTGYPVSQLENILADSGAPLILTDVENYSRAIELAKGRFKIIEVENESHTFPSGNPSLQIPPDTLAYIYYTSGSTGKPKGVVDDHRNVLHNVMRYTNNLQITSDDRLTLLQSSGFSGAVSNIFCSLLNGAALFPIDLRRVGVEGLARCINSESISIYHSVPTIFQRLLSTGQDFKSLRIIRLEGDRAMLKDLTLFQKNFGNDCLLVNGLGATETGITRQYFANNQTKLHGNQFPLGYATEDMQTLLLDENGAQVTQGEIGEIAIRSRYLARGYWRQPELTKDRFIPNPDQPGERTYLSGDLGYLNPDGELEYLGRKDFRSKFHGEWLDVDTIESALNSNEIIEQSLVDVRTDSQGTSRVVAYIVPSKGAVVSTSALRKKLLKTGIKETIIPTVFMQLDTLPVDSNGKISRQNLPEPLQMSRPTFTPSCTETERLVAEVYASVLGYSQIGRDDDFYALGGDSLDAISVSLQLEKLLDSSLPLALFAHATTVEKMASAIDQHEPANSLVALQPHGSRKPFFCVHAHMGHVINLRNLSMHLGPKQPFYALQLQGLDRLNRPPTSIAEMAQQYLAEIRRIQRKGPYLLSGYCYGGLVAMEMSRLLKQAGESVSLLALIDTSCPFGPPKSSMKLRLGKLWHRVVYGKTIHWRNIVENYCTDIMQSTRSAVLHIIWRYYLSRKHPIPRFLREPQILLEMIEKDYVPQPINCKAVVLVASQEPVVLQTDELWNNLIKGGVTIHQISVTASEMLREPQVSRLAKSLAPYLDDQ